MNVEPPVRELGRDSSANRTRLLGVEPEIKSKRSAHLLFCIDVYYYFKVVNIFCSVQLLKILTCVKCRHGTIFPMLKDNVWNLNALNLAASQLYSLL